MKSDIRKTSRPCPTGPLPDPEPRTDPEPELFSVAKTVSLIISERGKEPSRCQKPKVRVKAWPAMGRK